MRRLEAELEQVCWSQPSLTSRVLVFSRSLVWSWQYRSRDAAKEVDTVEQALAESTERAKVAESLLAKMSAELEKERKARAAVEERVASLEVFPFRLDSSCRTAK